MNLLPATTLSGDNRIHVCKAETLLRAIPTGCVDLIVTSPPYDNLRKYKGFSWNFEYIAQQSYRVLKQGGVLVWIVGDETVDFSETFTSFRQALYFRDVVGFKALDTMVYGKQNYAPAYPSLMRYANQFEFMFVFSKGKPKRFDPVQVPKSRQSQGSHSFRNPDGSLTRKILNGNDRTSKDASNLWFLPVGLDRQSHPAPFPEELARRHIVTWSNEGGTVLDFFMGSGTTAKMAALNNRRFIGCDISAEYVAIARERVRKAQTEARQLELITEGV